MWQKISCLIFLVFAFASLNAAECAQDVIDGDTFTLCTGEKVRLIGVDCPESQDPNKPVEYFSAEARAFLESMVLRKMFTLEYGGERTDRYGRLLCYVWVDDTILVNREIIKHGYGMAYLRFSHEREQEFLDLEIQARRQAVGMWASPTTTSQQPAQPEIDKTLLDSHAEIVYITKTGSKYHRGTCGYLKKSKILIKKKDAIAQGYGACRKCKP